jgi:phenylacetate-coenzyme A ligase PaaK-like adenylate-forming protein
LPLTEKRLPDIFNLSRGFEETSLEVFRYQSFHTPLYRDFLSALHVDPLKINSLNQIPFLPVELFKTHDVIGEDRKATTVFTSSGTSGTLQSKHPVADITLYEESFRRAFQLFYGDIREYCILALLPSYLEREGSSLIYMVQDLITGSGHPSSGFYLHNHDELHACLLAMEAKGQKTLLLGVSYALLDFAEEFRMNLQHSIVMETGGMKGKRKELVREELHEYLCDRLGVISIHSEYGMTELLSQAYSKGEGRFHCPPWMRVLTRDTNDPLSITAVGKSGGINVIDLANLHSCSFIATQDLGKVYPDHSFGILGRFDNSDVRGCNLMIE